MAYATSLEDLDIATKQHRQQEDVCSAHPSASFESSLLRQFVHPFFAGMDVPTFELGAATCGRNYNQCHSGITGLVVAVAEEVASQFQNRGQEIVVSQTCCAEVLLAAISLAMHIAGLEHPPRIRTLRMQSLQDDGLEVLWRHWQALAAKGLPLLKLEPRPGDWSWSSNYDWAKRDNSHSARLERLICACSTLNYVINTRLAEVTGMEFVSCYNQANQHEASGLNFKVWYSERTVLDEALRQKEHGHRVAVVNAGSAYHVGGGFLSGGRHSLEEAICVQSTLYLSLRVAQRHARKKNLRLNGLPIHIPRNGAVLSRDVIVFRAGTEEGYAPLEQPVCLDAVLTVAMPNMNPRVTDSPVVYRTSVSRQTYEKKWEAVIKGALEVGADVLVIPDAGCGVFCNDPAMVGSALAIVLRRLSSQPRFPKVILTGSIEFYNATRWWLSEPDLAERQRSASKRPKAREDHCEICSIQ